MAIGVLALGQASAMASRASAQVVQASNDLPTPHTKQSAPSPRASFLPPMPPAVGSLGVVGGIIDLMRARSAYKAGAAIINTGSEMQKEVLRLV